MATSTEPQPPNGVHQPSVPTAASNDIRSSKRQRTTPPPLPTRVALCDTQNQQSPSTTQQSHTATKQPAAQIPTEGLGASAAALTTNQQSAPPSTNSALPSTVHPKAAKSPGIGSEIGDIVRRFDFQNINLDIITGSRKNCLDIGLAPSYVFTSNESVRMMDENVKIVITVSSKLMKDIPYGDRTWKTVCAVMNQNPIVERRMEYAVDGQLLWRSRSKSTEAQIASWIAEFPDQDVLTETGIDRNFLHSIAAQIKIAAAAFQDNSAASQQYSMNIVDITVLRYPNNQAAFFKLYHLVFHGWISLKEGISSPHLQWKYNSYEYHPALTVLNSLDHGTRQYAVRAAETLDFSPQPVTS